MLGVSKKNAEDRPRWRLGITQKTVKKTTGDSFQFLLRVFVRGNYHVHFFLVFCLDENVIYP